MPNYFYRVYFIFIENSITYGNVHDRKHDGPGRPRSVKTEEMIENIERHFKGNPNHSIWKAAQSLAINRKSLRLILKYFLRPHACKITSHQRLTEAAVTERVQYATQLTKIFKNEELDHKNISFNDEAHFGLNGFVNNRICRF